LAALRDFEGAMSTDLGEPIAWGILNGLRDHLEEPLARGLLAELGRSGYVRVAERAREILAGR
jgi:hypothetical protein